MTDEAARDGRLDHALLRLERAIATLAQRLDRRVALAGAEADGAFDQDRAHLASELDACRARERELEEAGQQASQAMGQAIEALRAQTSAN